MDGRAATRAPSQAAVRHYRSGSARAGRAAPAAPRLGAVAGEPASYGGSGAYSIDKLPGLGDLVAGDPAGQGEGHVDAGRDTGSGDVVPVDDDPLVHGRHAERRELVDREPVAGGPATREQPGGREYETVLRLPGVSDLQR